MDLPKFLTYCHLKNYVWDEWDHHGRLRTIHSIFLVNNDNCATIKYSVGEPAFEDHFITEYQIETASVWRSSTFTEVMQKIAPEL